MTQMNRVASSLQILRKTAALLRVAAPNSTVERIAFMWAARRANKAYDLVCRLQVLEGVAGVPANTWTSKAQRGIAIAQEKLGDKVPPEWFSPKDTGMFNLVLRGLETHLTNTRNVNKVRVDKDEAMDMIQSALFGLGLMGEGNSSPMFWEIGKHFTPQILSGRESPKSIAPIALKFFIQKVGNLVRNRRRLDTIDGGGEGEEPAEVGEKLKHTNERSEAEESLAEETLVEAIRNRSDPLGQKIRSVMRNAVDPETSTGKIINIWLDHLEATGKYLQNSELAREMNIAPGTVTKWWTDAWERILNAVWSNRQLIKAIEDRYIREGVNYHMDRPADFKEMWKARFH